jgi:protocatechuate 3,4-dioxygenase alpha subunit
MSLQTTTWQTVGPYFRIGLGHLNNAQLAPPTAPGEHVTIEGRVLDGEGRPIPDAVIEIWQASADGEYSGASGHDPDGFRGFGRIPTNADGRFVFTTIKPGAVPGPGGKKQSPHLAVRLMMRGLLKGLLTRMYFPGGDLAADPVLQLVPEERRATLTARPSANDSSTLIWDIEMQGARETVFFDC